MKMRQTKAQKKRLFTVATIMMVCMILPVTLSCTKKKILSGYSDQGYLDEAVQQEAAQKRAEEKARLLQEERLLEEQRLQEQQAGNADEMTDEQEAFEAFTSLDIYFEYNSAVILPEAQEIIAEKAQWMRDNMEVDVMVEGHTDSRGTGEYNLALGERRAESVKAFLMDLGISGSRITTLSYGEERPLNPAENEAAWAKNRRAHFTIQ